MIYLREGKPGEGMIGKYNRPREPEASYTPLMATSNSPTFGQSNSPRQDG